MKIMLLAGEASGDLHGSTLARELRRRRPGLELFGIGGQRMAEAGVRLLFDPTRVSLIGFGEALRRLPLFRRWQGEVKRALRRERPDAVVLIDFGGFNLGVAAYAARLGIPAVYYIPPAAWAWGEGRAAKVAKSCTRVASVFPFEAEVYRKAGARVTFVGHPLLDLIRPPVNREKTRSAFGVRPGEYLVGLLPGSRRQEVEQLLPVMLAAGERLAGRLDGLRWALGLAPTIDRERVAGLAAASGLPVHISPAAHDVMQAADVLMVASGTATLEAALFGTPMVMVYRVGAFTAWLARRLVKVRHYALPNILAGEEVVPELVQEDLTAERLAEEVEGYLRDPDRRERTRQRLQAVVAKLGEPGAAGRAAAVVLEAAEEGRGKNRGGDV
ncbi:MAG: lipid-A-disaccharide synthase [Bacillota bacterium]|nr:lipid-A-disaccharide synthase [Bacillota bacterium]